MINNIVVQFACSLNEDGTFKEYRAVSGSVFNEEYSETLDSATIVLTQIPLKDRLINIKPYQYVRVYDKSGNTNFDKLFLVDSFDEKENNINEHIFGYTINLMSETKWLEKIQCPNLTITHEVKDGVSSKKTIYQYIKQYMDLFVPKIKFCNDKTKIWNYKPLLTYPTDKTSSFYKKFNVPCADMGFSAPPLRQLLTTLMQQVGCIPVVKNRVLGFLDFQANTVDFGNGDYTINNTVNSIRRSLSSDSYANTLVNISENVLDSGNEVICETLCFRDTSNVLLKQTENLYLETSLPIYKVNKCLLHAAGKIHSGFFSSSFHCSTANFNIDSDNWLISTEQYPCIIYKEVNIKNGIATIKFCLPRNVDNIFVEINTLKFWRKHPIGNYYEIVDSVDEFYFVLDKTTTQIDTISYQDITSGTKQLHVRSKTLVFRNISEEADSCFISGTFNNHLDVFYEKKSFTFIRWANDDDKVTYKTGFLGSSEDWNSIPSWSSEYIYNCFIARYNFKDTKLFACFDITKLVVENSIRQTLNTDFNAMNEEFSGSIAKRTIDNLSKYVYGTVGYSIGSKKIEGFSSILNSGSTSALGWIDLSKTYIENIMLFLSSIDPGATTTEKIRESTYKTSINQYFEGIADYLYENSSSYSSSDLIAYEKFNLIDFSYYFYDVLNNDFNEKLYYFTTLFFDIYYQPLNSFNLTYSKTIEDIDIPISQYDSNNSGLTDFDRLSIHEQEQVNRIGNETLSISQRTENIKDVQDFDKGILVFKEDTNRSGSIDDNDNGINYLIFKRSFSIGNNFFSVSYTGSKDAILKNYFTSIRTKYRAYQYVDYSSSTLRKERDTFYVRVATDFYNADDRIWLGNYNNKNINKLKYWLYDFSNSSTQENAISYECEYDLAVVTNGTIKENEEETVKNSVSAITSSNMIGFVYEYIDNVGAGTYLLEITPDSKLGGLKQAWQIWNDDYNNAHTVSYITNIPFYKKVFYPKATMPENLKKFQKSPIVDSNFLNVFTSDNVIFNVVDDNAKQAGDYKNVQRSFYKDGSERINHTVQFIYYAPNNDVLFGEDFMSGSFLISRFNNAFNCIYGSNDFEINTLKHAPSIQDTRIEFDTLNGNIILDSTYLESYKEDGEDTNYIYATYKKNISNILNLPNILIDYIESTSINCEIRSQTISYVGESQNLEVTFRIKIDSGKTINDVSFNFPYTYSASDFYSEYVSYGEEEGTPYIKVTWHGYNVIKLCSSKDMFETVSDIVVFKRPDDKPESTKFFFSINDTKTDYVLSEQNGMLYRRYKVKTETDSSKNLLELSRDVIDIYKE